MYQKKGDNEMKLVINVGYGGFNLSDWALRKFVECKGVL